MADIDVRCKECDMLLDAEFRKWGQSSAVLVVEPCKKCMDDAGAAGYDHGQENARKEADNADAVG